ncbi:hypothetical protein TEQG_02691 [Trichophyton equinum CBS 127.97]|uniref:Uncharacterized protein n=1 Tax=Trichophyton equinum (strain ATCC MYA-4606 / CBS 127.97) TaxID=559882 RepID=F2PP42_TRIEC|nr:hypothetical protein TEQG_02691 [Trichophyton equinum CBS 127.97]
MAGGATAQLQHNCEPFQGYAARRSPREPSVASKKTKRSSSLGVESISNSMAESGRIYDQPDDANSSQLCPLEITMAQFRLDILYTHWPEEFSSVPRVSFASTRCFSSFMGLLWVCLG